jgi:magnesium-transporting ATPase (P-type)
MRLFPRPGPGPTTLAQPWAYAVSYAVSSAALVALALAFAGDLVDRSSWFETGMFVYVGLVLVGGLIAGLGHDVLAYVGRPERPESRSLRPILGPLCVLVVTHLVVGLLIAVAVVLGESMSDDGRQDLSIFPAVLLVTSVLSSGAWILGTLATFLVVWPTVHLVRRVLPSRWVRDEPDDVVTVSSLFFLGTIAFAVVAVVATSGEEVGPGTPAGRGLSQIVLLWGDPGDEPWRVAATWVARALLVVLVALLVFWVRSVDRRSDGS